MFVWSSYRQCMAVVWCAFQYSPNIELNYLSTNYFNSDHNGHIMFTLKIAVFLNICPSRSFS